MSSRRSLCSRAAKNGVTVHTKPPYDFDVIIIGAGVGGHGAALHAVENGLKVAVVEGGDIGGTCVNRGCVPSKALLAAAGNLRKLKDDHLNKMLGLQIPGGASYDRAALAAHAKSLASTIRGNLARSLESLGVTMLKGQARFEDAHRLRYGLPGRVDVGGAATFKHAIIATGSTPFVPPGIELDGQTVFTSDEALRLEWVPDWLAIVGSGYIGLEFSDVYTALGSEVTFVEALPELAPGFDPDIARLARRLLIAPRRVEGHTGVLAARVRPGVRGVRPVRVELVDAATKEPREVLEVDACLVATGRVPFTKGLNLGALGVQLDRRGFVPVDVHMRVLASSGGNGVAETGKNGAPPSPSQRALPHVFCVGDANGRFMLAHAASAQGISAVENILGRTHVLDHATVPAACFTHPEMAFVGGTEPAVRERAQKEGWVESVGVVKTYFKGNSKALAEGEADGLGKLVFHKQSGAVLGAHLLGLHAADLIHEFSNAMALHTTLPDLRRAVHAHPTVSEVVEELVRHACSEMCRAGAKDHALAGI